MQSILQKTTDGATPLIDALGLNPYRVIPTGGDPTKSVLTSEEFTNLAELLVAEERITADEAELLSSQARDAMPADFGAVIEAAMAVELPEEVDGATVVTFETCDDCGLGKFLPHGRITVVKDDKVITRSPAIFTLADGFVDIGGFALHYPDLMNVQQAVMLFQSMVKAELDQTPEKADERIAEFDDETRAEYDQYLASVRDVGLDEFKSRFAAIGVDLNVEHIDIPGFGSGMIVDIGIPAEFFEPEPEQPREPSIFDRLFGGRRR